MIICIEKFSIKLTLVGTHIAVTYYIHAFTDRFDTVIFHSDADRSN